jgi:hypothetical protein
MFARIFYEYINNSNLIIQKTMDWGLVMIKITYLRFRPPLISSFGLYPNMFKEC